MAHKYNCLSLHKGFDSIFGLKIFLRVRPFADERGTRVGFCAVRNSTDPILLGCDHNPRGRFPLSGGTKSFLPGRSSSPEMKVRDSFSCRRGLRLFSGFLSLKIPRNMERSCTGGAGDVAPEC